MIFFHLYLLCLMSHKVIRHFSSELFKSSSSSSIHFFAGNDLSNGASVCVFTPAIAFCTLAESDS